MSEEKGLYRKYAVTRVDGKDDPPGTTYFVLRIGKDEPAAFLAMLEYANAVKNENPTLAKEIQLMMASVMLLEQKEGARQSSEKGGTLEMVSCAACGGLHWVQVVKETDDGSQVVYRCFRKMETFTRFVGQAFRRKR